MAADPYDIRPLAPDGYDAMHAMLSSVFNDVNAAHTKPAEQAVYELDRGLGAFHGDELAGAAGAYTHEMTVPGGSVPVACVTWVGVSPFHRRRGVLSRLMRRQLADVHERQRDPVAALWASEGSIYGRYGYGVASEYLALSGRIPDLRLPAGPPPDTVRPGDLAEPTELAAIYDRVRPHRVGYLDRGPAWWAFRMDDPPAVRDGATELRAVVHDGPGGPDGYAVFRTRHQWHDAGPDSELIVKELFAENPAAYENLVRYVFGLDLVRELAEWRTAVDEPFTHLVGDGQRLVKKIRNGLWVRLVDVPKALAARTYATDVDVVLDVADPVCPWNEGRWRLAGGAAGATCTRTTDCADLELGAADLGAVYLGGTRLTTLAATGQVTERTPGALARTSTAFGTDRPPNCPESF